MKSAFFTASVFSLGVLAAGSSFAAGHDPVETVTRNVSTLSRADVQAQVVQAKRDGFSVNLGNSWTGTAAAVSRNKSRAEVRSENTGTVVSTRGLERDYPVLR